MSDDFLDRARANWRASDEELERLTSTLRRKHVWSKLAFPIELATSAVAVGAGVFLIASDLAPYTMLARVAGIVLLVAVPILTTASWFARRAHPKWESETPEGVLRYAQRRLDVIVSLLRLARWHAFILAGFVAALWVFAALGMIMVDAMLAGFSVFYLGIAIGSYLWTRWRMAKVEPEREQCRKLLAEFQREA